MRAATRLVIPIDNPRESLIFSSAFRPNITIAPYIRKTPNAEPPNAPGSQVGFAPISAARTVVSIVTSHLATTTYI